MSSSNADAIPPSSTRFEDGRDVFRSTHTASAVNDSDSDIYYDVEVILFDSFGNRRTGSFGGQLAGAHGSSLAGPYSLDLEASLYNSGDVVTFTCETHVVGGFSAVGRAVNQCTVP